MRVLVTGSAGFVGSHLMHALVGRGDIAYGIDRKTNHEVTGHTARVALAALGPDVIVHLASSCSTPGSVKDPLGTFSDTVVTAVNVLEAAREAKVPVLMTSSVKARDGMTPYGAAKRMVELWTQEYEAAYSVPVVINRPGTIYGPGQEGSEDSGWIAWFCRARAEKFPVVINGDGNQVRDLLHVSDYVRLLLSQIDNFDAYRGRIWDVGGGAAQSVTVNLMAHWLGIEHSYGPSRYGDALEYIGVNDATEVAGWQPIIDWRSSETLHR